MTTVTNQGAGWLWSGEGLLSTVPPVGARVNVHCNGMGPGTVEGYFVEYGWLGLRVKLDAPPEWHRKQNAGEKWAGYALVFGVEVRALDAADDRPTPRFTRDPKNHDARDRMTKR